LSNSNRKCSSLFYSSSVPETPTLHN
jgi:hypothetical protein